MPTRRSKKSKELVGPWDPHERRAWRLPPPITPDLWAEQNLVLPPGKNEYAGDLRLSLTPWVREPLQMLTVQTVEEVAFCSAAQVAKTLTAMSYALYCIYELGMSVGHCMPSEDDAVGINVDRYQAIIESSPKLQSRMRGNKHETTREAIRVDSAELHFLWATSPRRLSSRSLPVVLADETDKYPPFSGKEASPIQLIRHRFVTFAGAKFLKLSTPTTEHGYIWQEFLEGDQRLYWVPCPRCNCYQVLNFGTGAEGEPGVHIPPDERNPDRIQDLQLAWYECSHCHGKILDHEKAWMNARGKWVPKNKTIDPATGEISGPPGSLTRLSYAISRLYAPWAKSTWSHAMAEFLRGRGTHKGLMDFRNSWLGEVWEEKVGEVKIDFLRSRCSGYRQGEIPPGAQILTAGVDVQGDQVWYVIRGWGAHGESWLIRAGSLGGMVVKDFDALAAVLFRNNFINKGRRLAVPMKIAYVDLGFAARKDETLRFCERYGCQPVRGDASPIKISTKTSTTDQTGRSHPLLLLDTSYFKSKIHRQVRVNPDDPGAWHLPDDLEEVYFRHFVVEQKKLVTNPKTGRTSYVWEVFPRGADNHLLDCEVYALAAAEQLRVEEELRPDPQDSPPEAEQAAEGKPPHYDQAANVAAYQAQPSSNNPKRKRISRTLCRTFR